MKETEGELIRREELEEGWWGKGNGGQKRVVEFVGGWKRVVNGFER